LRKVIEASYGIRVLFVLIESTKKGQFHHEIDLF